MITKGIEEYSIDEIVDNHIIFSKDGALSYLYDMNNPVRHSLDEEGFDRRIKKLVQAFQSAPSRSYLHKQDVYLQRPFDSDQIERESFLGRSVKNHFHAKPYTDHKSKLIFTLFGLESLDKAYISNPFNYSENLHIRDKEKIVDFDDFNTRALNILNSIPSTIVTPSTNIDQYIYDYVNGFEMDSGIYDIDFKDQIFGKKHFSVFCFSRAEYFPDEIPNIVNSKIGLGEYDIKEGYMDFLGEAFPYNHIYNQVINFTSEDILLAEIEESRKEHSKFRSYSPFLESRTKQLEEGLKHLSQESNTAVRFHSNVILMEESKEKLHRSERAFTSLLHNKGIKFYQPRKAPLINCFRSCIPGREQLFHKDFFYVTDLNQATSLFTHTTLPNDDDQGVYCNNRIDQKLLKRDYWDENNVRINARNFITVAATGGGKSVATLRKITQLLEQGVNVVVIEFGKSFEFITKLYDDISKHVKYNPEIPLGQNPFAIKQKIDFNKLAYLSSVIFKCWRVKEFMADTHVKVSMNKVLKSYYNEVSQGHSFTSFYHYVVNGGEQLLSSLDIVEKKYFDLSSFKHNCSEFIEGGKYESVFKVEEGMVNIEDHQLVVFELDQIKNDPFLVTLILLIIQDTIDTNILSDRSKKGMLIFDEFAETQAIRDMYTDEGVLETVAVLYQKIRKENGGVGTIIQGVTQLPDNEYTQSILTNTQILEVLPSPKSSYKKIKETFSMTDAQFNLMCSLENNYAVPRPYSELFLRLGERHFEVVRHELSRYEFLAFQTDGEVWKKLNEDYEDTNNLEESIMNYKP